jgi:hypothetical protein
MSGWRHIAGEQDRLVAANFAGGKSYKIYLTVLRVLE